MSKNTDTLVSPFNAYAPPAFQFSPAAAGTSQLAQPVVLGVCSFAIGATADFVAAVPIALTSDQVAPPLQGIAIGWLRR